MLDLIILYRQLSQFLTGGFCVNINPSWRVRA